MPDGQQYDANQIETVQHPTLGTLKFPKDMPFDERNSIIDGMLKSQPAPKTNVQHLTEAPVAPQPQAPAQVTGLPASSIGPVADTWTNRLKNVFNPLMEHIQMGGAARDPRLLAPEELVGGSVKQSQRPILTATGEVAGSLTTGGNIALMAGTGGLGNLPGVAGRLVPRLLGAGFSAQMIKGAYEQYAPFKEAMDAGDADKALYHFTHGVLGAAMATEAGQGALKGHGVAPVGAKTPSVPAEPTPQVPREVYNRALDSNRNSFQEPIPAMHPEEHKALETIAGQSLDPGQAHTFRKQMLETQTNEKLAAQTSAPATDDITAIREPNREKLETQSQMASDIVQESTKRTQDVDERARRAGNRQDVQPDTRENSRQALQAAMLPSNEGLAPSPVKTPDVVSREVQGPSVDQGKLLESQVAQIPNSNALDHIEKAGFKSGATYENGGQSFEHPDHPGITVTAKKGALTSPEDVKRLMADKLEEVNNNQDAFSDLARKSINLDKVPQTIADLRSGQETRAQVNDAFEKTVRPVEAGKPLPPQSTPPSPRHAGPVDFPWSVKNNIEEMMRLKELSESNPSEAGSYETKRQTLAEKTRDMVKSHLSSLADDQLADLRKQQSEKAASAKAQADAISSVVASHLKNKDNIDTITQERRVGAPKAQPHEDIVDAKGGRAIITAEEGKLFSGSRGILDEWMGRVPRVKPEDLIRHPVPKKANVTVEDWNNLQDKLETQRQALRTTISRDLAILSDTGGSIDDTDILDKLKELDTKEAMLGKYPQSPSSPGRRPNAAASVDPVTGAVKPAGKAQKITLDLFRQMVGKKVKQLPDNPAGELNKLAQQKLERASIHDGFVDLLDKVLKAKAPAGSKEAGAVGPLRQKAIELERGAMPQVPDEITVQDNLRKKGYKIWMPDTDRPSTSRGWLFPDGKTFAQVPPTIEHDTTAWHGMGSPEGIEYTSREMSDSTEAFLKAGYIRKASNQDYQVRKLGSSNLAIIEKDMINTGAHGRESRMDQVDEFGRLDSFTVDAGWTDLIKEVGPQVRARLRERMAQQGAAPITHVAGMALGGTIGFLHGGPLPGAAGMAIGFVTPELFGKPFLRKGLKTLQTLVPNTSMRSFFGGKAQAPYINADIAQIAELQKKDLQGPAVNYLERIAQLPANVYTKLYDKALFINDKPGPIERVLQTIDKRGVLAKGIQNITSGSIDASPYVTARNAMGAAFGNIEVIMHDMNGIVKEASDKGHLNNLKEYLNLKGYERVNDVMQERLAEHYNTIQNVQTKLHSTNLSVQDRVHLEDTLESASKDHRELVRKIAAGKSTPNGFDPMKVGFALNQLDAALGPQKMAEIKGLADKIFDMHDQTLDNLHANGIVSDEAYQTYKSRGKEYVPMYRILTDLAKNERNVYGQQSPLYLMSQNVIHGMEGSERVNKDPLTASAMANSIAWRTMARNQVISDYIKTIQQDPVLAQTYLSKSAPGQKAKAGNQMIGRYENGRQEVYEVPSYIAQSFEGSPIASGTLDKGLTRFKQMMQATTTSGNIAFIAKNWPRHIMDLVTMSKAGVDLSQPQNVPKAVADLTKAYGSALKSTLAKDQDWKDYLKSGAAFSVAQRNIAPDHFLNLQKDYSFPGKFIGKTVLDNVADFTTTLEDINKYASFKALRDSGHSVKSAMWETRNYGGAPDFSRSGTMSPTANMMFMFFNAKLQYVGRAIERTADNPKKIIPILGAMTLMAMALQEHNHNQRDEEGKPLWNRVPNFDKDNNWVILHGGTYQSKTGATLPNATMIPKPSLVKFFANPIEDTLSKVAGYETRSGAQLTYDNLASFVPGQMRIDEAHPVKTAVTSAVSSLNPVLRTGIEEMTNQTPFGPIVPASQQGLDPSRQVGPSTSPSSIAMASGGLKGTASSAAYGAAFGGAVYGKEGAVAGAGIGALTSLTGLNKYLGPRRVEHISRGFAGGASQAISALQDPFLGRKDASNLQGAEATRATPVIGGVLGSYKPSPIDQEMVDEQRKFYDKLQSSQKTLKTLQDLTQKNQIQDAAVYLQTHQSEIALAKIAQGLAKTIGEINRVMAEIPNAPYDEKTKQNLMKQAFDAKKNALKQFNESAPN